MPDTYLVHGPTGSGKTRLVLEKILGDSSRLSTWQARLWHTSILGPSKLIGKGWKREILLMAARRGFIDAEQGEVRSWGSAHLDSALLELGIHVQIGTYRRTRKMHGRDCWYLVMDEWHRIPKKIRTKCRSFCQSGLPIRQPWFLRKGNASSSIFLVSATPVNPVLGFEDEDPGEEDPSDEKFRRQVSIAVREAIEVVRALLQKPEICQPRHFLNEIGALGVIPLREQGQARWKLPTPAKAGADSGLSVPKREAEVLREFAKNQAEENEGFRSEYAYASGMIRTAKGKLSKRSGSSFRFPYRHLHSADPDGVRIASRWLFDRHGRLPRLISILLNEGVLKAGKRGRLELGERRCLIFCSHRAVSVGLVRALQEKVVYRGKREEFPAVVTNLDVKRHEGGRLRAVTKLEHLLKGFNGRKGQRGESKTPRILVATDVLSEGIDLHEDCTLVVHYELPWSPLRLFQRVGRLTRLITIGNRVQYQDVRVAHVIIPGSGEEERVNRLIKRTEYLLEQGLCPVPGRFDLQRLLEAYLGAGPSLHLRETVVRQEL